MTILDMHLSFDRMADIVATTGYPGLEPEEKDYFINRAIERFVKTRYTGNNPKGTGFDTSIKRIEDIRTLLRRNTNTHTAVTQSAVDSREWSYTLPITGQADDPYLYMVSATVLIDKDECGNDFVAVRGGLSGRQIKIRKCTLDEKEAFLSDPFHKPDYNEVLMLIENDKVYLYTNGLYDIVQFDMIYLTYPTVVDSLSSPQVDCNLPAQSHQEIVDNAVRLYLAGIGDQVRTQIESQIIREQE